VEPARAAARKLYDWTWLHRFALVMGPAGFVAVIAGWITTEVGRQPWVIYGLMRTADARAPIAAPGGGGLADRLRDRLLRRVRRRHLVHPEADGHPPHPARSRARPRARSAPPASRPGGRRGRSRGDLDEEARWGFVQILPPNGEGDRAKPRGRAADGRPPPRPEAGRMMDLTIVWAFIIAFAVAAVCGDGRLRSRHRHPLPPLPVGKERDQAMNAIAPVWDGNETWLVLGGGGLIAAFPLAYAIILPALYAPLIAMLLGLVFRGVAFEFRWRDPGHRRWWDAGFFGGSLVATFAQGVTLGALLQGITVEGRAYGGGWWDWLTPFSLLVRRQPGRRLCPARRLLADLEDRRALQADARRYAKLLLPALARRDRRGQPRHAVPRGKYYERWFEFPGLFVPCRCRCWCRRRLPAPGAASPRRDCAPVPGALACSACR
jgi:hypothetical protein